MDQRLQKILSAGGVCSRRKAEEYLREGRVTVNGVPAALGDKADPETDTIALDGVPVGRTETRTLLMLYKPRGVVTTLADEGAADRRRPGEGLRGPGCGPWGGWIWTPRGCCS
ncbi:MAG: S4 domain-containing protein [Evtepia sp.]